jgi:hypothetical protein
VAIAVELSVTQQPPHKSRRAELPHRAFQRYSHPQRLSCETRDKRLSFTLGAVDDMGFHDVELGH